MFHLWHALQDARTVARITALVYFGTLEQNGVKYAFFIIFSNSLRRPISNFGDQNTLNWGNLKCFGDILRTGT